MVILESTEPDYRALLKELRPGVRILRGCSSCDGAIYFQRDSWGSYFACLQAGHMTEADTPRGKELTLLAYTNQTRRKVA